MDLENNNNDEGDYNKMKNNSKKQLDLAVFNREPFDSIELSRYQDINETNVSQQSRNLIGHETLDLMVSDQQVAASFGDDGIIDVHVSAKK